MEYLGGTFKVACLKVRVFYRRGGGKPREGGTTGTAESGEVEGTLLIEGDFLPAAANVLPEIRRQGGCVGEVMLGEEGRAVYTLNHLEQSKHLPSLRDRAQ